MEIYADISRAISQAGGDSESPGYIKALTDPKYRGATIICMILAVTNQMTGVNAINIYSTTIYQNIQDESGGDGGISPRLGSVLNAAAQLFAAATSPLVSYFSFRTIINGGFFFMGISMAIVATFEIEHMDTMLVVMMMIFLAVYQWTLGTYSWVYLPAVACDEGLSCGTGALWLAVFIISLTTNSMFNGLGSAGTFFFFAGGSLLSSVFFFFFLKEVKGLTREQS